MGVFAIILTLLALMFFAYKGITVLILAPLLSMLAVLLTGEFPPLISLSQLFMPAAAKYVQAYFPVFLTGAVFGKLMGVSGAATSIATFFSEKLGSKYAIMAIVLSTAVLTYGGVSLFVVVFAIYPIGTVLFRESDIPKRLIAATIALGAFTFTMTALPGTPQYINTMPIKYFGTDIYAAPILGILGAAIMFFGGVSYLNYRAKVAKANGEGYGDHPDDSEIVTNHDNLPSFGLSLFPMILVFIVNAALTWYFKQDSVKEAYGAVKIAGIEGRVDGTWPVVISLSLAMVFILVFMSKYIKNKNKVVFDGAVGSLLPIFNTASEVGYGNVIKSLAAFGTLKAGIVALAIPSIFKVAISTTLLAAVAGSASGGLGIALEVLAKEFMTMGINPQALHRIMLLAASALDTMPHNGAVITLLAVCNLTHKQSYKDLAVVTAIIPLIATIVCAVFYLVTKIV